MENGRILGFNPRTYRQPSISPPPGLPFSRTDLVEARRDHPSGHHVCRTGTSDAPFGHQKRQAGPKTLPLPPCRRRETTFRRPRWWRVTSSLHR